LGVVAARRVKNTGAEITAMARQLGQRIVEAASEFREQSEESISGAQSDKNDAAWFSLSGDRRAETSDRERADGAPGVQLRGSKTRSRRSTRKVPP
jgi:hypothetical protein